MYIYIDIYTCVSVFFCGASKFDNVSEYPHESIAWSSIHRPIHLELIAQLGPGPRQVYFAPVVPGLPQRKRPRRCGILWDVLRGRGTVFVG